MVRAVAAILLGVVVGLVLARLFVAVGEVEEGIVLGVIAGVTVTWCYQVALRR